MIIMNSSDRIVTCSSGCHSMKITFIFLKGYKFTAKEEINDARKTVSPQFYLNEMDVYLLGFRMVWGSISHH